jgi:hypothetical protein
MNTIHAESFQWYRLVFLSGNVFQMIPFQAIRWYLTGNQEGRESWQNQIFIQSENFFDEFWEN